jgi:hypothetical protein
MTDAKPQTFTQSKQNRADAHVHARASAHAPAAASAWPIHDTPGQVRARLVAAALHPSCASKDSCIECLNNVGAFGPPALAGAVSLVLAEWAVCLQPLQLLTVFAHAVGAVGVLYSSNLPDTLQCRSPPVPGHSGLRCACAALGGT